MSEEAVMYIYIHYAVAAVLLTCAAALLVSSVVNAVAAVIGWKTPQRKRRLIRSGACLLLTPVMPGLLYLYTIGVTMPAMGRAQQAQIDAARQQRLEETSLLLPGDPAPDFVLTNADGETFSLADQRGKLVLINFFATWCGPCLKELPHVQGLWETRRDDPGFAMLVIGREETDDSVANFRDSQEYTFPIAADPDRAVYEKFATEGIPRTILLSPEGDVVFSSRGFYETDLAQLEEIIAERLSTSADKN